MNEWKCIQYNFNASIPIERCQILSYLQIFYSDFTIYIIIIIYCLVFVCFIFFILNWDFFFPLSIVCCCLSIYLTFFYFILVFSTNGRLWIQLQFNAFTYCTLHIWGLINRSRIHLASASAAFRPSN